MRIFIISFTILVLSMLSFKTQAVESNSYLFVSPVGSGVLCSQKKPCREIRQALLQAKTGSIILVAAGSYKGFDVTNFIGPLIIKAEAGAIIKPTSDRSDNRDTIFITNSSNITIDGLTANNGNRAGIRVDQSPNTTIKNSKFARNRVWAIFSDFSDNLTIDNNQCIGSSEQHGIYVSNSGDNPQIINNQIYNNAAAGIQLNADASMGGDGIISGALIENNVIYNNGRLGAAAINLDGVINSIIQNNTLYNNHATGIVGFKSDGAIGPGGIQILNNKITMPINGRYGIQLFDTSAMNTIMFNQVTNRNPRAGVLKFLTDTDIANTTSDFNTFIGKKNISLYDDENILTLNQWQALGKDMHSR